MSSNFVFLIGTIGALMLGSFPSMNSKAGQGKGGEIIAKPTPTPKPKKKTAAKGSARSAKPSNRSTPPVPARPPNWKNSSEIEFVWIPEGLFTMGSNTGDSDEKPAHQVFIRHSFYLGKYEVTQAQWQLVMGNNPSYFKGCDNCPVEQVSWNDTQQFIEKLNQMNDGHSYRLPTEAEWEYACRAGTMGDYAGTLEDMAWHSENSDNKTHPAGSKQPNAFGLFDMHGNVWEWCEDWYHETYFGAPTDGSAWLSGGDQKFRVFRGGSWAEIATHLHSAYRLRNTPDFRLAVFGFRLVAIARTQ